MKNKALFLDRDGIINIEKNYLYRIEDFEFIDGIFDICTFFSEKNFKIIVVTNQAGIGRGFYTEKDFQLLNEWMISEFMKKNIVITAVYFCPHHPEHGAGPYKKECYNRKPNPGMLLKASEDYGIDLASSIILGDKDSDMLAGKNAGIPCRILYSQQPPEKSFQRQSLPLSVPEGDNCCFGKKTSGGNETHIISELTGIIDIYKKENFFKTES